MPKTITVTLAVVTLLTACGKVYDESGSRLHSEGRSLLTTAGVRTIQRNSYADIDASSGRVIPNSITCAEPSPDIAIALGEGRSGGLSVSGLQALVAPAALATGGVTPSSSDISLALSLASSHAEAVAQLGERLATIQLLRDALYRACEAYANGAITPTIYTLMVSRMDELLVTLLSTEIAGGAFGRQLATAAAGGNAGAQASQAAVAEGEAKNKLEAANNAARNVANQQNKLGQLQGKLDATPAYPPEPRAQLQREVDAQRQQVENAQREHETKQKEALDALSTLGVTQLTAARSAAQGLAGAGGQIQNRTGSSLSDPAREIRDIQVNYINDTNADAAIVACIAELANTPVNSDMPPRANEPPRLREPSMLAYLCAQNFATNIKEFITEEVAIKREQLQEKSIPEVAEARMIMVFADMVGKTCGPLEMDAQATCVERLRKHYYGS